MQHNVQHERDNGTQMIAAGNDCDECRICVVNGWFIEPNFEVGDPNEWRDMQ
tara:strand:+ start:528 stop:683 length:156 start_codon:yes stop_codon:yes gene_type:complete